MEALIIPTTEQVSISDNFGYTASEVAVIQNTVAKGTSKVELAYFINVCKSVGLNPFVKEIWCYKDNKNNLLVFAGRDGFLSKAQTNPFFNGIRSSEVCKNDIFSIDIANNKIEHSFGIAERGEIVGSYAIVFRKDGEPTIEFADFKFYNKGYNTWKTHPGEMIKKVAETHALKKAFGISGIQSEYDFQEKNGKVVALNTIEIPNDFEQEQKRIKIFIDNSKTLKELVQFDNIEISTENFELLKTKKTQLNG
jgi:phage recombination protein Bet